MADFSFDNETLWGQDDDVAIDAFDFAGSDEATDLFAANDFDNEVFEDEMGLDGVWDDDAREYGAY